MEKMAEDYFDSSITTREHAIFEAGIKLASLFHMIIGAPIKNDEEVMRKIADGLKESVACQPFVKRIDVHIKKPKGKMGQKFNKSNEFDYTFISGELLSAEVEIEYNSWQAIGCVEWISDLNYPLMYIKEIKEISENS
jgi:hypothetical protein